MHVFKNSLKPLVVAAVLAGWAAPAMAVKFKMNAMCYLENKKGAEATAFNPTKSEVARSSGWVKNNPTNVTNEDVHQKFRIASLSKILVTHWAVATLGPEYRFTTRVHITPTNSDKSCFVHIAGDHDIFFGREILTNAFKQIKPIMAKQNCERIGQLSYDERLMIPMKDNGFIFSHRDDAGFRGNNPVNYYGLKTTARALNFALENTADGKALKVAKVVHTNTVDFNNYKKSVPLRTFAFKSRPLYMMLREFNAYSSNVPPNILFEKLGGQQKYNAFIATRLSIGDTQLDIYNGSGYPLNPNDDNRKDNLVSCASFVRIVQDLEHILKNYKSVRQFQLADVMPVGGSGEVYTTFKSLYAAPMFTNTLVAKTGSANLAITFGGMLSTSEGSLYFGVFTSPDAYQELYQPRTYIRDLVTIMANRYRLKKFDYRQIGLMNPLDDMAQFKEEANVSTSLK